MLRSLHRCSIPRVISGCTGFKTTKIPPESFFSTTVPTDTHGKHLPRDHLPGSRYPNHHSADDTIGKVRLNSEASEEVTPARRQGRRRAAPKGKWKCLMCGYGAISDTNVPICPRCGLPQGFEERRKQCQSIQQCGADWKKALGILDSIEKEKKDMHAKLPKQQRAVAVSDSTPVDIVGSDGFADGIADGCDGGITDGVTDGGDGGVADGVAGVAGVAGGGGGLDAHDAYLFSAALGCLGKAGEWEKALALLESMPSRGVTPDCVCYNATMAALKFSGRYYQAVDLLFTMIRREVAPDVVAFNLAIFCAGRRHNLKAVMKLMDMMISRGLQPDHLSFSTALGSCARAGDWKAAERLMHVMGARGVAVDTSCFAALVVQCEVSGNGAKALELLATMNRRSIAPNMLIMRMAVLALCKEGRWGDAVGVMDGLTDPDSIAKLRPDPESLRAVAAACEKAEGEGSEHAELLRGLAQDEEEDALRRDSSRDAAETKKAAAAAKKKQEEKKKKNQRAVTAKQNKNKKQGGSSSPSCGDGDGAATRDSAGSEVAAAKLNRRQEDGGEKREPADIRSEGGSTNQGSQLDHGSAFEK
eukprot:CAMPEP_0171920628 /NCGR_PEP_ID=MMETSP0993-20121228/19380_1 /TAXON_ID=483369 /ORGANISM="non described non described, Strain CCMP2098" /LENGTH=587 /DNA_ID=CAMNT_0012557711 /DNA_START=15 /DNA_END=1778 /DNA_ORIENTATION=-